MAKEMIAMLLAGGQGSRLYALTQKLAKPAVPFGGKYRIIDFPLSNCVNSGIDTVGILTQYQPLVLNEYIGNGQPWDLDRLHGGVHVLPPYQKASGSDWYKGCLLYTSHYMDTRLHFFKSHPWEARLFFEAILQPPLQLKDQVRACLLYTSINVHEPDSVPPSGRIPSSDD